MDLIEKELSDNLKKTGELEGGLFAEVSLRYCGRDFYPKSHKRSINFKQTRICQTK